MFNKLIFLKDRKFLFFIRLTFGFLCIIYVINKIEIVNLNEFLSYKYLIVYSCLGWITNQILCSVRLLLLLNLFGIKVSFVNCFNINMIGFFLSSVIPGLIIGDAYKIFIIKYQNKKASLSKITFIILFDRLLGFISILFVTLILSFIVDLKEQDVTNVYIWWVKFISYVLILLFFLLFLIKKIKFNNPSNFYISKKIEQLKIPFKQIVSFDFFLYIMPISFFAVSSLVITQGFISVLINQDLTLNLSNVLEYALLSPISIIASIIPLSPSGIGIGQVTLGSFYQYAGYNFTDAVYVTTIIQLGQIIIGSTIGLICFILFKNNPEYKN